MLLKFAQNCPRFLIASLRTLKSDRLLGAALALCCMSLAAEPTATARLGTLLQQMRHFEAGFRQSLLDERGELLQESEGRVQVRHPGRFRWQTTLPAEQLVVSDGTTVWQYDPDLMQAVTRPLDKRADQIPSLLLSGDIDAVARLCEITTEPPGDEQDESFRLLPHDSGDLFSALTVSFRAGVLQQLDIHDGMGQRTRVLFEGVDTSRETDEALFHFDPPPGVDVVNDE